MTNEEKLAVEYMLNRATSFDNQWCLDYGSVSISLYKDDLLWVVQNEDCRRVSGYWNQDGVPEAVIEFFGSYARGFERELLKVRHGNPNPSNVVAAL